MSEEVARQVVGAVLGAIDEAARVLSSMPSVGRGSQANYGVVLGISTVVVAAAVGGMVYFGEGRPPWLRKKKHQALSRKHWAEAFEAREGGRLADPERILSKARRGGIDISIRAAVWPFLLGLYDLRSTAEERAAADAAREDEFRDLRRECEVLRAYVAEEMKRRSLERVDSGSFEKVNEAEVRESMAQENADADSPPAGEAKADASPEEEENNEKEKDEEEDGDVEEEAEVEAEVETDVVEDGEAEAKTGAILDEISAEDPAVESFLKRGAKAVEDFRDWLRIIRLDAVRMNAEWVPYSTVQANVTEEEAEKRADEVGIPEHSHLEACRTHHAARLVTILEAYALYDPDTGYCQGMSDLLSPFVALMESDAQAFWCFVQFMKKAKDNFRMDETGIRRQLGLVGKIFEVCDPQFYGHLVRIQAQDCFFVYRMIVVLLRRELSFDQTVCLWEVVWADWAFIRLKRSKRFAGGKGGKKSLPASDDFLLFTIAAAVLQQRRFIIERCREVDEILRVCNAMAGKLDIWDLIDDARGILKAFQQKVGHEKRE